MHQPSITSSLVNYILIGHVSGIIFHRIQNILPKVSHSNKVWIRWMRVRLCLSEFSTDVQHSPPTAPSFGIGGTFKVNGGGSFHVEVVGVPSIPQVVKKCLLPEAPLSNESHGARLWNKRMLVNHKNYNMGKTQKQL